jgi:hypothetical protein
MDGLLQEGNRVETIAFRLALGICSPFNIHITDE